MFWAVAVVVVGLSLRWKSGVEAHFAPQWSTQSFHFDIPPQTEICDLIYLQNSGIIHQLTLTLPLSGIPSILPNFDLDLHLKMFSDNFILNGDCLFYSSTTSPNDIASGRCSNVVSRPLELIGNSFQLDVLGVRFNHHIELCINSSGSLVGEFALHIKHQHTDLPPKPFHSLEIHLFDSSPQLDMIVPPHMSRDQKMLGVVESEASTPGTTIEVNSLIDSPSPNLLDCESNQTLSQCNLRSALFFCNHSLSTNINSTCLISLPPHEEIVMNLDYGSLLVDAEAGTLSIQGNGCRISSLHSSPISSRGRFLVISPPDFASRQLHFLIENCSISHFGSIDKGGALALVGVSSVSLRHMSFLSNEGTYGGALSVQFSNSIEFHDCLFFKNSALVGAGVFVSYVPGLNGINFVRCEFDSNQADSFGGGISFYSQTSSINILSSLFKNNFARGGDGGAIFFNQECHNIQILDSDFISNAASYAAGGAIYFGAGCSNITLAQGRFDLNSADTGGCLLFRNNENVRIEDCLFHNSTGGYDSSVMGLSGKKITITDCSFLDNTGVAEFGIYITPTIRAELTANLMIDHCQFSNNSPHSIHLDGDNENVRVVDSIFTSDLFTLDDSEGGLLIEGALTGTIEHCTFLNTTSSGGGGALLISMISGLLHIVDCDFVGNSAEHGGAVLVDSLGDTPHITFSNCLFERNQAMNFGGAVYLAPLSIVSFHDTQFLHNFAVSSGGGMYLSSQVNLSLTNSSFIRNKSLKNGGGGLYSSKNNTLSLNTCLFQNNLVLYGGGGAEIGSFHSSISISNSQFLSNFARNGVGGLSIGTNNFGVIVSNCLFYENSGNTGGIQLDSSNSFVYFDDVIFQKNSGVTHGGGLYVGNLNSYVSLTRCSFIENNVAEDAGGGIYFSSSIFSILIQNCNFVLNVAMTTGGAIHFQSSNQVISVLNSFISQNSAHSGGGIYLYSSNGYVLVSNTSLLDNFASVKGGGFYLAFQNQGLVLDGVRVRTNVAGGDGGGCYLQSGNDQIKFLNTEFVNNIANEGSGGGIFCQDSNLLMSLINCSFISNFAHRYGGGINLHSSNFEFLLTESTLIDNVAEEAGGGLSSSLSNDNLTVSKSLILGSVSRYGGSIYIGDDHERVTFSSLHVSESAGEYGGAIYVSSFNDHLLMENCDISDCQSLVGGVVTTYSTTTEIRSCHVRDVLAPDVPGILIDGFEISVSDSVFENNLSVEYGYGSLSIMDAILLIVSNTTFRSNVGYSGVGLTILNTASALLDNLQFFNNSGTLGGGVAAIGVLDLFLCNSTFIGNQVFYAGGAAYFSDVFNLTLSNLFYSANHCENYGGALAAYYTTGSISRNSFHSNVAMLSGSAIYLYTTDLGLSHNSFSQNLVESGGGAVFWGPLTTMLEPRGLTNISLNQFVDNIASYGPNWATDGATLMTEHDEYNVTKYDQPIPPVLVKLIDEYQQLVVTDSITEVEAIVSSYYCDEAAAYITGKSSVQFVKGVANLSSINAYCAPGYSMNLQLNAEVSFYAVQTLIHLKFRPCHRGEYYAGQECLPCESGTYSLSDDTSSSSSSNLDEMDQISVCHSCPQHVKSCEGATLVLEQGYWRISMDSDHVQSCPMEEACQGGESAGDESCEIGYEGPLCAVCELGYAFRSSSRRCVPCSESSGLGISDILVMAVIGLLALLLIFYFSRAEIRQHLKSFDDFVFYLMVRASILEIDETTDPKKVKLYIKLVSARLRARLKVYITLYQILSALPFVLDLQFPSPVNSIIYALHFINISISGSAVMTCSASSSYDFIDSLVVETTYPMVFVLLLFSIQWIHFRIIRYRRRKESHAIVEDHISSLSSSYFFIFLLFTYLILPSVATKIFQTFRSPPLPPLPSPLRSPLMALHCSCQDVDPDDSVPGADVYMSADYSVSCHSEKYQFGFIWAIVMVFVYPIGCPLYYFCLLYDVRHEIRTRFDNPPASESIGGTEDSTAGEAIDQWRMKQQKLLSLRFLYESYSPNYWWWELVETSQRLLLTGILVIIGQGSAVQILIGSLISLCYIFAHRQYKPDMDALVFSIKIISFWQIFFVFWIALLIKADFPSISVERLGVCLIFVIFLNLFIDLWKVSATAMKRWREGRKKGNDKSTAATTREDSFILLDEMRHISVVSETEMGTLSCGINGGGDVTERSTSKSIFSIMQSSPLHGHPPLCTSLPSPTSGADFSDHPCELEDPRRR